MNRPMTFDNQGIEQKPQPETMRWAVVGGGMLGMTTALRLAQKGQSVTLFDSSPEIGGLTSAWKIGDVHWDRFYHVTLLSDLYLRTILRELELESDMEWVQTRTGFYSNGKLHSLSSSLEFLKFPVLNLYQKFRLGSTIFFGSKLKDWESLEEILVEKWLRRWSGNSTFEKIWLPLLKCKLGESYQRTNAAFIWAYIQRMYAARRSGMKREMFGYVPGGYLRVLKEFSRLLIQSNVDIRLGSQVTRVHKADAPQRWTIETNSSDNNANNTFDRVIMTVPSSVISNVVPDLDSTEREALDRTEYLGVLCTSLLIDKPLGGYYVTNITDPGIPITGVIEMGTILPPEKLGGNYLVYLPQYMLASDPGFSQSDQAIHDRCLDTLEKMYPHFQRQSVRAIQTARAKYVMAMPTIGYSKLRAPIVSSQAGLYFLNSARIVDGTLNVNEIIRLVETELPQTIWPAHLAQSQINSKQ